MGFLDDIYDVIESIKTDREDNAGILDELKDSFKKTDIGSTIDIFKKKGLGGVFSSWVSPDENKPVTKDQIKEIFGLKKIEKISKRSGMSEDDVSDHISKLLPEIIDRSTPNGKIEE
jgi:uncharacterized protein YidB (DUF937 family)